VENEGPAGRNEEAIRSLRAGGQVAYAAPLFSSNGETVAIIPEIVVRVKPEITMEKVQARAETAGCTIRERMEFTEREYLLEVLGPDAEAVFAAAEELGRAAEVEWACPNTAMRPKLPTPVLPADRGALPAASAAAGTLRIASSGEETERTGVFPNDEYFPNQWHLYNTGQFGATIGADIRAPEAWEITAGDPDIVVAVVDSGVESNHPDLVGNLTAGYDFFDGDDQPDPAIGHEYNGHGTFCAGFIAAQGNNGIGVTGVTWNCKIMPIRMSAVSAEGAWHLITEADIATAFRWSARNGADILSNSWGLANTRPILHSAIMDITTEAGIGRDGKGCVVLFASGNDGSPITAYPQKYSEVIVVGATDNNDVRWSYSNYGPELDITAPSGERWYYKPGQGTWSSESNMLWTTDLTGPAGMSSHPKNPYPDIPDYVPIGGTSSACPIAAGVVALILSIEPDLMNDEVRHFLERSAKDLGDPGRDDYYGWGRVDARAALDMVLAKRADLNNDWKVNEQDLAILTAAIDANDLSADIAPAAKRDGIVDERDVKLLTRYLGTVIPEMGLIAYWKLDETEGVVAHDSEGKHNATIIGVPLWHPEGGAIGGALEFSGVPNFATARVVRDPSAGPLSVFAWVKGGGPGQVVISQQAGANWLMADGTTGALMTGLSKTGRKGSELSSAAVITDGDWHRIGFTWDGRSRALYVDGMEVAQDTQDSMAGSTGSMTLGAGSSTAQATFWKGLIDDVRVYDRAVKP
jgi:subtilisin family serine protease